jgi:hypothetical protein
MGTETRAYRHHFPNCRPLGRCPSGQLTVRFFKIRADGEDSAADAGLGFAVKERPVVERLKHEPLVDPVDPQRIVLSSDFAGLLTRGIETEVHQNDETVEGNQQASVLLRSAPVTGGRLEGEEFGPPTFDCDAGALSRNRVGFFIGEVPHDLPADGRESRSHLMCAGRGA